MKITEEEIRLLAKSARNYPQGHGKDYIPGFRNCDVVNGFFLEHPEMTEKGWPAVCLASVRGELGNYYCAHFALRDAVTDIASLAWENDDVSYISDLDKNPILVAEKLEALLPKEVYPEKTETWRDRSPLL